MHAPPEIESCSPNRVVQISQMFSKNFCCSVCTCEFEHQLLFLVWNEVHPFYMLGWLTNINWYAATLTSCKRKAITSDFLTIVRAYFLCAHTNRKVALQIVKRYNRAFGQCFGQIELSLRRTDYKLVISNLYGALSKSLRVRERIPNCDNV